MRNVTRVLAFDVAAPLAAIAALLIIGVMLGWPLWWVSICSILGLLVVQAVIVNVVLFRRDSVTVGTDDDAPAIRLAVVAITAAALAVAAAVGYARWTLPDRAFTRDTAEVVRIAVEVGEATATFSPTDPASALDRAASMMTPESAEAFKAQFAGPAADLAKRKVTAQARTISTGLEALSPSAASVDVLMRGNQTEPGKQTNSAVLALRVALSKLDDGWKVVDVTPINSR
jgi:hypothetical protein